MTSALLAHRELAFAEAQCRSPDEEAAGERHQNRSGRGELPSGAHAALRGGLLEPRAAAGNALFDFAKLLVDRSAHAPASPSGRAAAPSPRNCRSTAVNGS